MEVAFVVWALAAFALFAFGIHDIQGIGRSLHWLRLEEAGHHFDFEEAPFIIILLPVLREQKLISETLQALARLKYSHARLRIFVITTEKERVQREQARASLASLAKDIISRQFSPSFLAKKYLGVLPEDTLRKTLTLAWDKGSEADIHAFLLAFFDIFPTTMDIVDNDTKKLNKPGETPLFIHLHYPETNGYMNQQLAFALQQLPSHFTLPESGKTRTYLAIYNADSRPHADSLLSVINLCRKFSIQHTSFPPAIQQSAVFLENIGELGSNMAGLLLQAAAVLQTRWVLAHEIPRLHRQNRSALQFQVGKLSPLPRLFGSEFALCVGHGFFLRYDLAESLDLFSMSTICDDLLWSLRLCIEHLPVLPLPLLESAESPTTLKALLIQKKSWFLGYTEYLRYRQLVRKAKTHDSFTIDLITFHGILRAMKWLLLSPTLFVAFGLPIILHSWQLFLITVVGYAIYGLRSYWIILTHLETLRRRSGGNWNFHSPSFIQKIPLTLFSLPAFLIESIGLWWCLLHCLCWAIMHQTPSKQKTER